MIKSSRGPLAAAAALAAFAAPPPTCAQTELNLLYGNHLNPFSGSSHSTWVLTVQHSSQWQYGSNFLFIDLIDDNHPDEYNDTDAYGELYSTLSLGKLTGVDLGFGPIADFGLVAGASFGADSNFRQWLPSLSIAWQLPGFIFLFSDIALAIDAGGGLAGGGLPEQDNRFITTIAWLLPFELGGQSFSFSGVAEHQTPTVNEHDRDVPYAIFSQPQVRWDVGGPGGLMIGVEGQHWTNKDGADKNESIVQLLLAWEM